MLVHWHFIRDRPRRCGATWPALLPTRLRVGGGAWASALSPTRPRGLMGFTRKARCRPWSGLESDQKSVGACC
jgi:hypothetical protein